MNKRLYCIMMGITSLMFLMVLYSAYLQFYPFKILVLNEPTKMVRSVYHPGDPLTWSVNVTHYTTGVKAVVTREVVGRSNQGNDVIFELPSTTFVTKAGTSKFIQNTFILSISTPPGHYHVVIDGVYYISQTRAINFHDQTNDFEVVQ